MAEFIIYFIEKEESIMSKKWDFLKEVTDIDDRFIEEAAGEWIQPISKDSGVFCNYCVIAAFWCVI